MNKKENERNLSVRIAIKKLLDWDDRELLEDCFKEELKQYSYEEKEELFELAQEIRDLALTYKQGWSPYYDK